MTRVYTVPALPVRPADGHKGTFKRILVVGGSPEMLGAPVLSSTAALRAGAGLVQIAHHPELLPHALEITPELVGHALDSRSDKRLIEAAEKADAVVVGPGMGTDAIARRRLKALIKLGIPSVIDADALTLLAEEKKVLKLPAGCVLTPHPGEMKRLGKHFGDEEIAKGDDARIKQALKASEVFGAVVILKGARTVVAEADRAYVEPTVTSALGKAGTGDVLAGVTGCFLAQLGNAFDAAVLGVHLHALAGASAGEDLGERSVLARDVIDHIRVAIEKLG